MRSLFRSPIIALAVMTLAEWSSESASAADFAKEIEPILIDYCYDCHGDGMDKGDVALDTHESVEALRADLALWEGVHHNMEAKLMPPSEKRQPSDQEIAKLIAWIEADVFKLDPKNPDPGRVTLRRLNRDEYNNTVRDLIGLDLRPADEFPADDTGYGFDNIGAVLTLSPALLDRYVKASQTVLDTAIVTEAPVPGVREYVGEKNPYHKLEGSPDLKRGTMSSNAKLGVKFTPPADGEYRIEVDATGSPSMNEWPLMRIILRDGPQKDVRVTSYDNHQRHSLPVKLKKGDGERWIEVAFLNDKYDPDAKDPKQRDRNLFMKKIRVVGPLNRPVPAPTEAHRKLFRLDEPEITKLPEKERAREVLRKFATRAWRRPVVDAELDRLMQMFWKGRENAVGDDQYSSGIKLAFQAAMVSSNFLYRGDAKVAPDEIRGIDEFSLASRLSYFLWSTMPDETLFELARKGELRKNLDAQITRMLADGRASELTENFAGQWLQLRNLDLVTPNPKQFGAWNEKLRDAMRGETERFFAEIVAKNRSVLDFLDADFTWVNEPLARHYGIPDVKGDQFQRVALPAGSALRKQRGGVLSQASVLTITSNPTRTSAVNRGNWVLENLLGSPPPPPPADLEIPELEESGEHGEGGGKTLRQQLELHLSSKLCASCHKRMDPIGFGLENFDAIGKWRDTESGQPLDTSGKLYTGEDFNGPAELRKILADTKRDAFVRTLSEKMLTYALGRGLEYYDKPAIHEVAAKTADGDYRFHALVKAVVNSTPFQKVRGESAQ